LAVESVEKVEIRRAALDASIASVG
jgi:hypothetical protein